MFPRTGRLLRCALFACLVTLGAGLCETTVKRERNEATLGTAAANVAGNGNIGVFASFGGTYGGAGLHLAPAVGAQIGIGGLMQFSAQSAFSDFREVGPIEAHLQATLPGNDGLRLFGLGLSGDLYLSTANDTVSLGVDSSKSEYKPNICASLMADLDWISKFKNVPLKTYLLVSLADNPQVLFRYYQLAVAAGFEWKMYRHSIFADVGAGFYNEKKNKLNISGDGGFKQYYAWVMPGGRYRLFNRVSIMGGVKIAVFEKVNTKINDPLTPVPFALHVRSDIPLLFKETNTEAIRTLVFMEQEKQKNGAMARRGAIGGDEGSSFDFSLDTLGEDQSMLDFGEDEGQMKLRREEIQKRMDDIEKLLGETQDTGEPAVPPGKQDSNE